MGNERAPIIELVDVCAGYDGRKVLEQLSLKVFPGQITVLAGPNGCGKSTLLKTICALLKVSDGNVYIDGKLQCTYTTMELARKVAYLPQKRNVPEITVEKMVLHGRFPYLKYPKRYRKEDVEIAETALKLVDMQDYGLESVRNLSGGMQQKVYIAQAVAQDTPIILLDEPTNFLDIAYQMRIMGLARTLADSGKAVVMVLHDIALALKTADYMVVMENGKIAAQGTPQDVFKSGVLHKVYKVDIKSVETSEGTQYYYH